MQAMAVKLQIDEGNWPKVYVTWPSEPLTDEEFRRGVMVMSDMTRRGQPFVVLHDGRKAARPSPTQRSFAAQRQKADAEHSRLWLKGSALVVASPVIAGVVTAINWVFPPPYPQKVFATLGDAEEWIQSQLGR